MLRKTKGTPSGQHWLRGFGAASPLNSISPCFFTASAAAGFRIGLVESPTNNRPGRRITGPGPESGGPTPKYGWVHIPEKSGTDAVLAVPLLVSTTNGATACPKADVAAAAANAIIKRTCRCLCMPPSLRRSEMRLFDRNH